MVTIEEFLEAGVHFGHRVTKWNPKMAPYIFAERKGVHIIDLVQSLYYFKQAVQFLNEWKKTAKRSLRSRAPSGLADNDGNDADRMLMASEAPAGGQQSPNELSGRSHGQRSLRALGPSFQPSILLVGTKKQASQLVKNCAERLAENGFSAHYVNHRWLGGLLTNWSTMKICIDQLNILELREQRGEFDTLPKKEKAIFKKEYDKLNLFFGGVKKMKEKPNLVIIIGQDTEMNAVRECYKLGKLAESYESREADQQGGNRVSAVGSPLVASHRAGTAPGRVADAPLRTITLLDTNCDPSLADIFIPANDDSTKSLELILNKLTNVLISD